MRGNRTESLWEGNLPLRGSLRGPLKTSEQSLKTSEKCLKRLKTLPPRDPLRGRFPSQRLSVLLPLFICPLNSLSERLKISSEIATFKPPCQPIPPKFTIGPLGTKLLHTFFYLVGRFGYFLFFLLGGGEGGVRGDRQGVGVFFFFFCENQRRGGGLPGGGGGSGGCLRGIWGGGG